MADKQALKADYKQNWHRLRSMGVYQIKNTVNGKVFVDSSFNLEGAIERDRRWLTLGGHMNSRLQQDWNAFGPDAFQFELLEALTPTDEPRDYREEVDLLLEAWKAQLEPYHDRGYLPAPRR